MAWITQLSPEAALAAMAGSATLLLLIGVGAGRYLYQPRSDNELKQMLKVTQRDNAEQRRKLEAHRLPGSEPER